MADIHAHAPKRFAAAQCSSAVQQHSMRHTWPCNEATYLRDGRVGVEAVGQGLSSFCAESVRCDIDLFDKKISRGRAPADEQHSASSCVSVTYIHMHTATTPRDTHIAQNTPTNAQIRLAAKF